MAEEGFLTSYGPEGAKHRKCPEGLALGGEEAQEGFQQHQAPVLCSLQRSSGVRFALLGIDPQRPLVDSLIEN